MTETPRVSVVIPAYNMEAHLAQTIESILRQTFTSFEVLVVDDCSTDDTPDIVEDFRRRDDRIRYFRLGHNSNLPAVPRNRGIEEARGDLVAFLDHDDLWSPRKLERQVQVLDRRPDLAMVHSHLWDFAGSNWLPGLVYLPNPYRRRADYEELRRHNVVQCSSVVARREVLRRLGGFDERPELRAIEDYHLWLRIARDHKIAYISEIHGWYRWMRASTSRQKRLDDLHRYMDEHESTRIRESEVPTWRRVVRKVSGYPLAVYFHLIEGPLHQWFGWPPRLFET